MAIYFILPLLQTCFFRFFTYIGYFIYSFSSLLYYNIIIIIIILCYIHDYPSEGNYPSFIFENFSIVISHFIPRQQRLSSVSPPSPSTPPFPLLLPSLLL